MSLSQCSTGQTQHSCPPGTYNERLSISGKTITLASEFYTTGDASYINTTIIDAGGSGAAITVSSSVGPDTTIIGFTIRNGSDGILPSGKLNILNNRITGNGDGIDYEGGGGLARDNLFENNRDDAIDFDRATEAVIENNIIRNNRDDGIEIRLHDHTGPTLTIVIRNNSITGNEEDGIQLIDYPGLSSRVFYIERNLIANSAMAGIGLMDGGDTTEDFRAASIPERIHVYNNTFSGNNHGLTGGDNLIALNNLFVNTTVLAMKNVDAGSIAAYNLFWNSGTDIQGSVVDLDTTLFADPLLDPNYHLLTGSPAIDAGAAYFEWNGETVLDLPPSAYFGAAPDMGWRESDFAAPTPTPEPDTPTPTDTATPIDTPTDSATPPEGETPTATATATAVATETASPTATDTATSTDTPTATDTATATATDTPTPTFTPPPPASDVIYISSTTGGTAGGVSFADEDILAYSTSTGTWSMYFDGSDVGLGGTDVNAFHLQPDGSILISFNSSSHTVPGLGTVQDRDIVGFVPTSTGAITSGSFEWFFDGSDVGLTASGEDIDAIGFAPGGRLLISTTGSFSAGGASGNDEDLFLFSGTTGPNTSGTFSLYFDGSDVGLNNSSSEDVIGVWVDALTGEIYLTTVGSFAVNGLSGDGSDIFVCKQPVTGSATACSLGWSLYWDGSASGFAGEVTDGVDLAKGGG